MNYLIYTFILLYISLKRGAVELRRIHVAERHKALIRAASQGERRKARCACRLAGGGSIGVVKSERGEEEPMSKKGSDRMSGSVMIVGGGIAGMQAALDLADSGYLVKLVEKSSAIGGVMSELDKTFPTNDCAM